MTDDSLAEFKSRQRDTWPSFAGAAVLTTPVAAHLVNFADVRRDEDVLDVGCGTGVVAITAARRGANVSALDLTPELLEHGRRNEQVAECPGIKWSEGDVEELPYPNESFDVVLSQFGHMFAPRPKVALAEMRRVLKRGGRIAFATWPPEHFVGRFFALVARHSPPAPQGAVPPPLWGSIAVVSERLADGFEAPFFERGVMRVPALSLGHLWTTMCGTIGPLQKLVERVESKPEKLAAIHKEMLELAEPYFSDNVMHQSYLLTRAHAR